MSADSPSPGRLAEGFRIGEIRVHPQLNRLSHGTTEVRVEPKVMEILTALAAAGGSPLSRDQLLERAWPEVHVSDDALHRAIWKLRQALEEVGGASGLLETIPKRGYRLAAEIETAGEVSPPGPGAEVEAVEGGTSAVSGWVLATAALVVALAALLFPILRPRGPGSQPPTPRPAAPPPRYEPLTALRGYESSPSLAPDAQRVVFHHYHKSGERQGRTDLYISPTAGGEPARLDTGEGDAMQPAWSPVDDRIAHVTRRADGCRLQVVSLADRAVTDLGSCGVDEDSDTFWFPSLAWASDAREIFVSRRARSGEPAKIYAIDPATGNERVVSDPPLQAQGDGKPTVSPDGRWIAFQRRRADDVEDLYLVSLEDGRERRLTSDHQPLAGIAWTPDSRELVFASSRAGTYRLWRLPVEGGAPAPVETVGMNATGPALSRTGDLLVYEEWKSEINIWSADPSGRRPRIASTLWDWRPQLSPDGASVAFLSNREGSSEIWVARADGSEARRLTQIGRHFATMPRWSPDGERLVFAAPVAGDFEIWTVVVDSGAIERLTRDASQERAPSWSADGRTLFFASDRTGSSEIWSIPAAGGPATRVTEDGGQVLLESPGGKRFLVKTEEPGIWRIEAGEERLVVPDFPASHWMNVCLAGETLYFTRFLADWTVLLERLTPDGAIEPVGQLDGPTPDDGEWFDESGLAVSTDGSTVLWASVDYSDSDLWVARYDRPAVQD